VESPGQFLGEEMEEWKWGSRSHRSGHEAGDGPSGHLRFISEKEDQDADADPD